jgi:hypothetical protein
VTLQLAIWSVLMPVTGLGLPQTNSEVSYVFPDRGGVSYETTNAAGTSAAVAYTRISPTGGSSAPPGFGIFGFRNTDGVLVTEASVRAVPLIRNGRTVAEVAGTTVNTGIAFANPNAVDVRVDFYFSNPSVSPDDFGHGTLTIGANQQFSGFLSAAPFNLDPGSPGSLTFTADQPIAAVALTQTINTRGESLYSALPVVDLDAPNAVDTAFLPHFATGFEVGGGGRWTTDIILVNPTDDAIAGTVIFVSSGLLHPTNPLWDTPGVSTPVSVNGSVDQAAHNYAIGPKGVTILRTTTGFQFLRTGSVRVVPATQTEGFLPVTPVVQTSFFNENASGVVLSQAAFPGVQPGWKYRMYVESSGTPGQAGAIQSGFAISQFALNNDGFVRTRLNLELTDLEGNFVASTTLDIPSSGQRSMFLENAFEEGVLANFERGVLRIEDVTENTSVAITGLRARVNQRGEFLITTTPPVDEDGSSGTGDRFFPHLVDGGGWSTQAILFSGRTAQSGAGTMQFIGADGQPFDIPLQ